MKSETALEICVVFLKGFGLIGAAVAIAYKTGVSQWADSPDGISAFQLNLVHWGMFEAGCVALVTFLSTSFGKLQGKWSNGGDASPPKPVDPAPPKA